MKFHSPLLITLVAFASCQENKQFLSNEGQVIVTGKIARPIHKTLTLTALEIAGRVTHVAQIDSIGGFRFDVEVLSAHDNYLRYGDEGATIFLEPIDSLHLVADGSNFKNSLEFSGDQAKFNECLRIFSSVFGKALNTDKFWEKKVELSPVDFKNYASAFFDLMASKVDSITNFVKPDTKKPEEWLHTYLKYRQAEDLIEYGKHHHSDLDPSYYDFIGDYVEPDPNAMECSQYFDDFIRKYHMIKIRQMPGYQEMTNEFRGKTHKGLEGMIDFIDRHEPSRFAKDIIVTKFLQSVIEENHQLVNSVFGKYLQVVTDITCQNFLINQIEKEKTKPHSNPSLAELENLDHIGDIFKEIHQRHRDKVLYLDLWGTWCRPCVNAFPHINKLNKELNDGRIEFIFLCINSTKNSWEKARKDYDLPGTHYLLTDDQHAVLSKQFNIRGLPRYIIIDHEGKVVNADAPLPDNNSLKNEIINLMKM